MTLRVVVGEDEPFVREGIVRVLERADFEVVGVAADSVTAAPAGRVTVGQSTDPTARKSCVLVRYALER